MSSSELLAKIPAHFYECRALPLVRVSAVGYGTLMMKTDHGGRVANILLAVIFSYQLLLLAIWLKLDLRPPRWDESAQLLLAEYSFERLRQFDIIHALRATDLTLTKSGFVPFMSALTFFVVGNSERIATFVLQGASYLLLAVAMRSLSLRLFDDALVGAATFALLTCSYIVVRFSHFYMVDPPLMALVAFAVAAAVEIRARDFRLCGWTVALGCALLVGIGAKHLFAPFVAAPLLVVAVDGIRDGSDSRSVRVWRIVRQSLAVAPAIALGVAYHILNFAIIAEQLKRATTAGFYAELGSPPSSWIMLVQLHKDLLNGLVPLGYAAVPGLLVLLVRARFALVLLASWCLGVWLVVLKTAAWPLIYYYMPLYPAAWLFLVGWLGRGPTGGFLRPAGATVLVALTVVAVMLDTRAHLGTLNPLAVVAKAPAILAGPRGQRNPFGTVDSTAPDKLDGNLDVLPYAHDWKLDDALEAMAKSIGDRDPGRSYNVGLMADDEYLSGDLLSFKLHQLGLSTRFERQFVLGDNLPSDADFLIMKSGEIYKEVTPALKPSQQRAESLLADDARALRARGFALLYEAPLPDRSTITLWVDKARLSIVRDFVSTFGLQKRTTPITTFTRFEINGDSRAVLYEQPAPPSGPPTTVRFEDVAIPRHAHLNFGIALEPAVWDSSDGVEFVLDIEVNGISETLFKRIVDPKERPEDRRWIDVDILLDGFTGTRATLLATALPRKTADYDHAGWSCLCITVDEALPQAAGGR
jgi:hypothetical protein